MLVDPGQRTSRPGTFEAWREPALVDAATTPACCQAPARTRSRSRGPGGAQRRDGAALTRFLHWLATEGQVDRLDEIEGAAARGFREERPGTLRRTLSFDTIAGAGLQRRHRPLPATPERLNKLTGRARCCWSTSGAQYLDGTTDVTRTVAIGEPDAPRCASASPWC